MAKYIELFVAQFLDSCCYAAVIFEPHTNRFYNAPFETAHVGGAYGYQLKDKGTPISIDTVRKLAARSESAASEKYVDITEDDWREFMGLSTT